MQSVKTATDMGKCEVTQQAHVDARNFEGRERPILGSHLGAIVKLEPADSRHQILVPEREESLLRKKHGGIPAAVIGRKVVRPQAQRSLSPGALRVLRQTEQDRHSELRLPGPVFLRLTQA